MLFKPKGKSNKRSLTARRVINSDLLIHCCVICCPNHSEGRETRGIQNVCQTENHYLMKQPEKNPTICPGPDRPWHLLSTYQKWILKWEWVDELKSIGNDQYRIYHKCQSILYAYSLLLSEGHGQLSFLETLSAFSTWK